MANDSDAELLRAVGGGNMSAGLREVLATYHKLWALGYRPGVPLTFWIRQKAKKKGPRRAPKVSAMATEYNPKGEGEDGVDHSSSASN